jgi:hypothetical protein
MWTSYLTQATDTYTTSKYKQSTVRLTTKPPTPPIHTLPFTRTSSHSYTPIVHCVGICLRTNACTHTQTISTSELPIHQIIPNVHVHSLTKLPCTVSSVHPNHIHVKYKNSNQLRTPQRRTTDIHGSRDLFCQPRRIDRIFKFSIRNVN